MVTLSGAHLISEGEIANFFAENTGPVSNLLTCKTCLKFTLCPLKGCCLPPSTVDECCHGKVKHLQQARARAQKTQSSFTHPTSKHKYSPVSSPVDQRLDKGTPLDVASSCSLLLLWTSKSVQGDWNKTFYDPILHKESNYELH